MLYPKYESGKVFGEWTILEKTTKRRVLCKCTCGTVKELYRTNLGSGKSISCGCLRKTGYGNTKLYNIWASLKSRCLNKNHRFYKDYGGRGITVCEEWLNNVDNFGNWALENGYKEGLSIDRIDNNKGYEPQNCKWVNQIEQCNNKRNNLLLEYNGKTKTVSEWAREMKLNYRTLLSRIRRGMSKDRLFLPTKRREIANE